MAKGKKKPTKKASVNPVVKKVEPSVKAEAKVEEAILEAASDGVITEKEVVKIEEVKEEVKEGIEKLTVSPDEDKQKIGKILKEEVKELEKEDKPKPSKHEFPTKETCKHSKTKRTLGRNSRVQHVCINPECGIVVRWGGR